MANFRYYKDENKRYPRRTSIDGQLDKPGLKWWSAGCACDYITDNVDVKSNEKGFITYNDVFLPCCGVWHLVCLVVDYGLSPRVDVITHCCVNGAKHLKFHC